MGINAKKIGGEKTKFAPQKDIEPGVYPARLVQVIDFGLQAQRPYKGEAKKPVQEIGFTYELVDEFMKTEEGEDITDKPRWVSETLPFFGMFADRAKSTKRIEALDPNDVHNGDVGAMVGTPINVTLVNNKSGDKVYTNVANIASMRPRDAQTCPDLVNPTRVFDLDNPDREVFESFPEWIREKIKGNLNYAGSPLEKLLGGEDAGKTVKEEAHKEVEAIAQKAKERKVHKEVAKDDDPEVFNADELDEDTPW